MAEHDLHTIGTATFEEVSLLPRNILLRNQTVAVGDIRYTSKLASNLFLECTTAGTTSSSAVSYSGKVEGNTVTDGTAVFEVKKVGSGNGAFYGTCSTAAATVEKTVACSGFKLKTGADIIVKFTVTNTATNPTLNVNSTGAKAIYYRGAAISASYLAANRTYEFAYNGTQYELVGDLDSNDKVAQNVSSTNATYPILLCPTANATANQGAKNSIFASGITVNPSTKTIKATTFDGNATAATTAFNVPTQSGLGNIWIE